MSRLLLTQIAFDAGTQIRAAIDQTVVSDYAEAMTAGAVFPPLVVFHDGNQNYLADGFHRFLAAQRLSFRDFDVDVRPGTKEDALWFALGANRTNGKRLTAIDKKHAIELALKTWGDRGRTQAEIALQIGIPESTLSYHAVYLSNIGRIKRPATIIDRDGRTMPTPARGQSSKDIDARRIEIERRLRAGEPEAAIAKSVHIHRNRVFEIKRELGLTKMPDRSRDAIQQRHARMRQMAEDGHSSRQIAAAIGLTEEGTRATLRKLGIAVPADRAIGRSKRHDSNRIVEQIVADAENLVEGVNLIEFAELDRERLIGWLKSLQESRDKFGAFIRRLMKEQQHGEAA